MTINYLFIKDAQTLPVVVKAFTPSMREYPLGSYCTVFNPSVQHARNWWRRSLGSWDQLDVSDVPKEILAIKLLGGY
jgi:hypothetical protein